MEFTIIGVMVMGVVLGGIDLSIQHFGRIATTSAALAACEQARTIYPLNPARAAQQVADQTGLKDVSVVITPSVGEVRCTVSATSGSIFAKRFTQTAIMPKEGSR